jgi:SAM-dependent methyltransferase
MADPPPPADLAAFYAQDRLSGEAAWQDHEANLARFARILRAIERHRAPGRFLDVGCSIGTSLVVARERGWQAVGLELSQPAAAYGREKWQLDIRAQTLADAAFPSGSFDAVLMHHTLEHVEQPDRVVADLRQLLAPGGVLYLALPNHGSWKGRLLGPCFGYGVTVEHLWHFTVPSLRRLVAQQGMRVLRTSTWSYRQDPRLLWDLVRRCGWQERFQRRYCGGAQPDMAAYFALLQRKWWARFVTNWAWPAWLARVCGGGEDLHLLATPR